MFRFVTRFTIAVLIGVGATLSWQSYGDVAGEMLAARAPTLAWLVSISTSKPPIAATTSTSQTQHEPLAPYLDAVRLSIAQLAAMQDQMAQRLIALQAVEDQTEDIANASVFGFGFGVAGRRQSAAETGATQGTVSSCAATIGASPAFCWTSRALAMIPGLARL
jgi:hypothetical protein